MRGSGPVRSASLPPLCNQGACLPLLLTKQAAPSTRASTVRRMQTEVTPYILLAPLEQSSPHTRRGPAEEGGQQTGDGSCELLSRCASSPRDPC